MSREQNGPVDGVVVLWNGDEGWGAIASPVVDGEVWTHFTNLDMVGYATLARGQAVSLVYETPGQDGYPHRAVTVRPR